MFLLRLGLRNVLRNPRRSALSLASLVAGVALFVVGQGLIGGVKENIVRAQIDTLSGHVHVQPAGYPTDRRTFPLRDLLRVDDATAVWLDARARGWTPRILFGTELIAGADSVRVRGVGFDTDRDRTVFPRDAWRIAGREPATAADGVLLGRGPAQLLALGPGDLVTLRARTRSGAINALQVPVAGVVSTGNPVIDHAAVLLPWPLAVQLIGQGGLTSHVAVRLADRDDAEAVGVELATRLGDHVEFVTWRTETADLIRLQEMRQRALDVLTLVLLAMAAAAIANTLLMAAWERVREVGTLQALGMTRGQVVRLFLVEGTLLGTVGGLAGGLTGAALVYRGSTRGIDLSAFFERVGTPMSGVPLSTMLYFEFRPDVVVAGVIIGVIVAALASLWPALIAARLPPAEAVRT